MKQTKTISVALYSSTIRIIQEYAEKNELSFSSALRSLILLASRAAGIDGGADVGEDV